MSYGSPVEFAELQLRSDEAFDVTLSSEAASKVFFSSDEPLQLDDELSSLDGELSSLDDELSSLDELLKLGGPHSLRLRLRLRLKRLIAQ